MYVQITRGSSDLSSRSSAVVCIALKQRSNCPTIQKLVPEKVINNGEARILPYAYTTKNERLNCCGNSIISFGKHG